MNSISVELTELGRYAEARRVLVPVTSSPLIATHPEWRETAADERPIERRGKVLLFPYRLRANYAGYRALHEQQRRVAEMALFEKETWRLRLAETAFTCAPIESAQLMDAGSAISSQARTANKANKDR